MALALLKAAQAKAEADRLANEEFEKQLLGIADGDALDVKNSKELGTSAGTDEPDEVLPTLGEDDKSRENADAFVGAR